MRKPCFSFFCSLYLKKLYFPATIAHSNTRQCSLKAELPNENRLFPYLKSKILATGPITVAEYMKEVLLNPFGGYYMHQTIFGTSGDFITSPEISQLFGELIAVWFFNEWSRLNQPTPVQLVELGPGRGTLSDDILRVFSKFVQRKEMVSLHLVEISPHLQKIQRLKLCGDSQGNGHSSCSNNDPVMTKYGFPVTWHTHLQTVPNNFTLLLAHEFFDALPIHKFQKTKNGWREVLIGYSEKEQRLQYTLAPGPTIASNLFIDPNEKRNEIEISPESGMLIKDIVKRMTSFGGISMIIDYGYSNFEKTDTFRSFKNHKMHDPLLHPGTADLTADVDFSYLIKQATDEAITVGPVSQATFLKNMGIDIRLEKLTQNASEKNKKLLLSGCEMLVDEKEMGERYKFIALFPSVLKDFLEKFPPAGFS